MPSLRHETHQADTCGQEHLVDGALAQTGGRDPVVLLRRPDLYVERLIVDADLLVASAGEPPDVAPDLLLEEARGLTHRHAFGDVDCLERLLVDADSVAQGGQLIAPGDQPLGLAGHLLGVHGVRVDAGDSRSLVVARPLERRVAIADLGLEPFASAGVAGQWTEGAQRGRLLLDLERGPVAQVDHARGVLAG